MKAQTIGQKLVSDKDFQMQMIAQNDYRIKNGHCYHFGIYSFNYMKWKSLDASEYRIWCNSTQNNEKDADPNIGTSDMQSKRFLTGYIKNTNLLMLVVEDEDMWTRCGNIEDIINEFRQDSTKKNESLHSGNNKNNNSEKSKSGDNNNDASPAEVKKANFKINRYRQKTSFCYRVDANESHIFTCTSSKAIKKTFNSLLFFNSFVLSLLVVVLLL
jgi:hypothetical protein